MMRTAPKNRRRLSRLTWAAASTPALAAATLLAVSGLARAVVSPEQGADLQDVPGLEALARSEAARQFPPLTDRQRFVIGPIEPQLQLQRCRQPVRAVLASPHHMQDRATIELRCQDAKPWHLYVQVRIVGTTTVAVAAHAIVVGSVLKDTDLRVGAARYLRTARRLPG